MNILYTNFHLGWGGQPYQVQLLAMAMQARGHNVWVAAPSGSRLEAVCGQAGVPVMTACRFARGFRPATFFRDVRAIRDFCRTHRIDVIHSHGSQDGWVAALSRQTLSHDTRPALVRTKHNSYPAKPHWANRWFYGRACAAVIAVAEPICDDLVRNGLADAERVLVIPAACNAQMLSETITRDRAAIRSELDIPQTAPVVILVGRLAPDKGQEMLIRAMPRIRESFPEACALLVGKGGDNERLQGILDAVGVRAAVRMAGFRTDVADLTAAADCAVLAATACDASSTVLKEAMGLRVPVVGTDVGGTAGILDGGGCGLLIPPGDIDALAGAVVETLAHPDAAAERVERAYAHVAQYSAESVASQTEACYRRVVPHVA